MSWPHAPSKIVKGPGLCIVTAGTYHKEHNFKGEDRLKLLQDTLFEVALETGWELQAWAVFSNHYHLVGISPGDDGVRRLSKFIHARSALHINRLDNQLGRKVWYRCRDTHLTNEKSYLARLAYVHNNPRKHLNVMPENYPYCSMHWFKTKADRAFYETVMSFPYDGVSIEDDF